MFDFLKKNSNEDLIRKHFSGFQDGFNEKQKKAILYSLYIVARSDNELHKTEIQFLEEIGAMLGCKLNDDFFMDLDNYMESREIFSILKSLTDSQKEWYIVTAITMIQVDGKSLKKENEYTSTFFSQMGITQKWAELTMSKAEFIMRDFK
jgi:hypothetical protein